MDVASRVVESPRSLRWHRARIASVVLYPRAFASFGHGSVMVKPQRLQGVARIHIGDRCAIYEGAWLACEPDGGPITIGNDTYMGQGVHLHAIDPITIGAHCMLADGVYIGSADHDRRDRSTSHGTGPVEIGRNVFLGQRSVILGGVTIGDGATVGAHAVVTRDVPAGAVVGGVPARVLG